MGKRAWLGQGLGGGGVGETTSGGMGGQWQAHLSALTNSGLNIGSPL